MTIALKKVFSDISKLPISQQNAIAELLIEELAWKESFENSQNELEMLAKEASVEYKSGKTKPLNLE